MLQGKLFIKMFVAFWLLTIVILGSWVLTSDYFDNRPPTTADDRGPRPPGPPHRFILRTIYNLQHMDLAQLSRALADIRRRQGVDIYLLDAAGQDLLGRELPADVAATAAQLHGGRRRAFDHTATGRLLAHEIYRPAEGWLKAVFVLPPHRTRVVDLLGASPLARVALAVLISGLVCFGLSRLLTNRLKALQLASRRLASGDLDTRLAVRTSGGDETDELARDFNTMAGQLQERIQAQKQLLGDVSHELRSPLARLRVALALAQARPGDREDYLARIETETARLEELIGELLSSQSGTAALDSDLDLVTLLAGLCDDATFEGQARGRQAVLDTTLARAPVRSGGDLLRRGFENILRNALHHSPDDTAVSVSLERVGDQFRVAVTDCGPGVPAGDLENIFTPFYRVDRARSRQTGGYGLGLAIARRAMEYHGGSIVAANTGSGLRVTVHLPAGDP